MSMKFFSIMSIALIVAFTAAQAMQNTIVPTPMRTGAVAKRLSEYGFFQGNIKEMKPDKGVIPYYLNNAMFSDHAFKTRYLALPQGQALQIGQNGELVYPLGTALIKHFYYPEDFRKPHQDLFFVETRLLIKQAQGWQALTYRWNDEQTEAFLDEAGQGQKLPVAWLDTKGQTQMLEYQIPSLTECGYCHSKNDNIQPIGLDLAQLHHPIRDLLAPAQLQGKEQLQFWIETGLLASSTDLGQIPTSVQWDNPKSGSISQRARAYLDINCGHCHQPGGSAESTGLFLHAQETHPERLGIGKTYTGIQPEFAGHTIIQARKPDASALVQRMATTHHKLRMPNIGVQMLDEEGLKLIKAWIQELH